MTNSNNPPAVVLELNRELAEFLMENCDANIRLGLGLIMKCESQETAQKLVDLNEKFKQLRDMLKAQGIKTT